MAAKKNQQINEEDRKLLEIAKKAKKDNELDLELFKSLLEEEYNSEYERKKSTIDAEMEKYKKSKEKEFIEELKKENKGSVEEVDKLKKEIEGLISQKNTLEKEKNNLDTEKQKILDEAEKEAKVDINARNKKAKYSDDEIARARYEDSKAKFIVRDRISDENINTNDKWISISNLNYEDKWDKDGNYVPEIKSFDVEIFDRTERPKYRESMTEDEKHQLTYAVAEKDIEKQKRKEKRSGEKVYRPNFHVDISSKRTKDRKTEYNVNSIKRKK